MTPDRDRLRRELLAARYQQAVEAADLAAQGRFWQLAAADPTLVELFRQVHDDLLAEQADREAAQVGVIEAMAREHLTAAEVVRPAAGPVTVGDVAGELFRHTPDRLPAAAHALNEALRASQEPLPADLGLSKLTAWAEGRFGPAPAAYWKAFREAALKLELRRAADTEFQLAARQAAKPKERP